jgi:hypothetical protein
MRSSGAYEAFRQPVQACLSCFTRETLIRQHVGSPGLMTLRLTGGGPIPLGRRSSLKLLIALRCRIVPHGDGYLHLQTAAYSYWLFDRAGNELMLFQWDPDGAGHVATPHLHIRALTRLSDAHLPDEPSAKLLMQRLARAHVPTGPITLAQVLRMAIDDLGVEPLEIDGAKLRQRLDAADDVLRASLAWQSSA